MDDFSMFILFLGLATIAFIMLGMRKSISAQSSAAAAAAKESTSKRQQMAEDIKMTKTSQVVDQVAILDELSEHTPNFRQYCELVGTSQAEGGVTAPYSRRQVAYYEIRCYRIDNNGSGDVETLVAHEKSFDPFYFKDASCDTPIYVDINTFAENVILINSTNHIEGPNSDFAKAVGTQASSSTASGSSSATSYAVARVAQGIDGFIAGLRELLPRFDNLLVGPQLAFAGVGSVSAGAVRGVGTGANRGDKRGSNLLFAEPKDARGRGESRRSSGGFLDSAQRSVDNVARRAQSQDSSKRPSSSRPQATIPNIGQLPPGFGTFLNTGTFGGGFSSVPRPQPRPVHNPRPMTYHTYRRTSGSDVLGDMITGMVLSTILDSMAQSSAQTQQTQVRPTNTFRGYRLVEDVVPLNSPVYCIGEIYYNGTNVYMGRSLAQDYPTSFFATKPESEVLLTLGG